MQGAMPPAHSSLVHYSSPSFITPENYSQSHPAALCHSECYQGRWIGCNFNNNRAVMISKLLPSSAAWRLSCPAGCNVAVFDLTVSQSTLTGFATGWPQCARPSSLRPRGLLKTPGRSPASPCDWSSNWARAASEKSGWVRGRHTRHAGTCSDNSSRCLAFCLVFSRSYVDMSTQDRPRFI